MYRRLIAPLVVALACLAGWSSTPAGWTVPDSGWPAFAEELPAGGELPQAPGTARVQAPPLQPPAPLVPAPGNPVVTIATSHGEIVVELFNDRAPVSVENFLAYANEGFYNGTVFHRVVSKFMIQGGGYTPSLAERPTRAPIQNEATNGLRNLRGTLAMARKAALRSATAQFYINVADNRMLDHTGFTPSNFGYAVFGRVLEGMDVVDKIASVKTGFVGGMDDVPLEPVTITSVQVKTAAK